MAKKTISYPITRKELEDIYLVHKDVLRHWLRDIGITHGGTLKPIEVELIRATLGEP